MSASVPDETHQQSSQGWLTDFKVGFSRDFTRKKSRIRLPVRMARALPVPAGQLPCGRIKTCLTPTHRTAMFASVCESMKELAFIASVP